jgi:hypothetical protein
MCCISMVGGTEPNSKERIWIDFSIDGRGRLWNRSLRKSRTVSAIASSSFVQSKSTDISVKRLRARELDEGRNGGDEFSERRSLEPASHNHLNKDSKETGASNKIFQIIAFGLWIPFSSRNVEFNI